jgi:phage N-6-adenine-methyltransferase
MSKKTDERSTSDSAFLPLHEEFNFEIDLAASHENHKLPRYYTKENSAFNYLWNERCFLNPPFSNLYRWVEYASESTGLIVCILPCDTSTKWFHDFIWDKRIHKTRPDVSLRLPQGRYRFGKWRSSPKFATIIAIFNEHKNDMAH